MGDKMAGILEQILSNIIEESSLEIEGIKRRWQKRMSLIKSVRQEFASKLGGGFGLLSQIAFITPSGRVHYGYSPKIMKGVIHY